MEQRIKADHSKSLAIIWHSRTGASAALAKTAYQSAAQDDGVNISLLRAQDAQAGHILRADGYLFICPENLAAITGEMKEFFDRCYYPVLGQLEGRPYAALITAGSDGENALRQIERIATGWRLRKIMDGQIICTKAQTEKEILAPKQLHDSQLKLAREVGAAMSAGLALGIF